MTVRLTDKDTENTEKQAGTSVAEEEKTVSEAGGNGGRQKGSFWYRLLNVIKNKYLIATVAFAVWVFFIDSNNLINWYRDMKVVSEQRRLKRHYVKAIQYTDEKLRELSSNKDSLERFAREQYFFHEDGEDVFIVE